MRQGTTAHSSILHRLCQSALLLSLLPFLIQCQGTEIDNSNCNQDCSGHTINPVCASNGVTYDNKCKMDQDACLKNIELEVRDYSPCNSPEVIPMKGETCTQHSERIRALFSDPEWRIQCSQSELRAKSDAGTITMGDLIHCYRPDCNRDSYAPKQCHSIGTRTSRVDWCWCSGPTGLSISDTLTSNMQPNECILRRSCHYQGSQYSDGEVFQPVHRCGICECLDGNVTCFEDFVPDVDGNLNSSQLNQLSDLLKQFFYFENNHKDSILYDIRDISNMISHISNDTQMRFLNEWFQHYDSDGNGCIELNHTEEVSFHDHIHQFTSCKHFLDHVSQVFDVDSSSSITIDEWLSFFIQHTTTVERAELPGIDRRSVTRKSMTRRSLQNRKKFFYILS